jgi:hypothetical protein
MRRVFRFLARLLGRDLSSTVAKGIEAVRPYLDRAIEVVALIAKLTPNRTDDEIAAAARALRIAWPTLPLSPGVDRAEVLHTLALTVLRSAYPSAKARWLNRAIELALGAVKP